jgi:hypothetical protein
MADEELERLWSVWERSKIAAKNDKFFGKHQTQDVNGNVLAKFFWVGRVAFGWYTPMPLSQAAQAVKNAEQQESNTMTQKFPGR